MSKEVIVLDSMNNKDRVARSFWLAKSRVLDALNEVEYTKRKYHRSKKANLQGARYMVRRATKSLSNLIGKYEHENCVAWKAYCDDAIAFIDEHTGYRHVPGFPGKYVWEDNVFNVSVRVCVRNPVPPKLVSK